MADPRARMVRIRDGLTPSEWARAGVMVAVIVGLNVLGWVMLGAAGASSSRIAGLVLPPPTARRDIT